MIFSVADPRERMTNQLLMRGHASVKELLTASFGEWPPKGLDINPAILHDQQVELKTFVEPGTRADATISGERSIRINREICGNKIHSTMGHETTHILQGDHYWRARQIFGAKMAQDILRVHNDAASNMIMKKIMASEEQSQKSIFRKVFNAAAFWRAGGIAVYFTEGIEVQARIHQMMIDGYSRWEKMPQNRDELWAALANAGLKPPPAVRKYLDALPENSSVRRFLPGKKGSTWAASDIRAVSGSFSESGRCIFWTETLPALYADLIEMYGDKPGRERFGLGVNSKAGLQQKPAKEPAPCVAPSSASRPA